MRLSSHEAAIDLTEFRRGWRVLVLALTGVAISINAALLYGFGSLVVPLQQAFGWERGQLQACITFLFGSAVISLQLAGWLNQRYGMKRVTLVSVAFTALGYFMTTQINGSIWTLYAAFALLPLIGVGCLAVTWTQLINLWFDRNRGLALGIGLCGTGVTAAVIPSLLSWGVQTWDWRAAFIILGLLNLLLLLPLAAAWLQLPATFKGKADSQEGAPVMPGMTFRQGIRTTRFWTCNIALGLVVSATLGMVTNTIPMLRDRGLSAVDASLAFSFFGFSLIFGRMLVGYLLDRLWPPAIAAASLILPSAGCLIFLYGSSHLPTLGFASALLGFGAGAELDIAAFLMARYFGLRAYGRLFGVHQGFITIASALAPLLFASLFRSTGTYTSMLVYCTACSLIAPLLLLTLGRVPRFQPDPLLTAR